MTTSRLYCPIRKIWVAAIPEEQVRQGWLQVMREKLGYPQEMLGVEKALHQMPHIEQGKTELPDRRADIVCYAKGIHPHYSLYPLLLIECKAAPLTAKVKQQVTGYNLHVGAYFIAIANEKKLELGWWDPHKEDWTYISHLPSYQELVVFSPKYYD